MPIESAFSEIIVHANPTSDGLDWAVIWSAIQAGATIGGVIAAGIAAWFAWRSFSKTREMVEIMGKEHSVGLRPYLTIGRDDWKATSPNSYIVHIEVINTGKIPAKYTIESVELDEENQNISVKNICVFQNENISRIRLKISSQNTDTSLLKVRFSYRPLGNIEEENPYFRERWYKIKWNPIDVKIAFDDAN